MNTVYRLIILAVSILGMQQVFSSAPTQSIKPIDVPSAEERRATLEAPINEVLKEETQDVQKNDIDNSATSSEEVGHAVPVLSDSFLSAFSRSEQGQIKDLLLEAQRRRPAPTRIFVEADGTITSVYPNMTIMEGIENFDLSRTSEQRGDEFKSNWEAAGRADVRETLRLLSEEEEKEALLYIRRPNYPALSENNEQYDPSADDDLYATH